MPNTVPVHLIEQEVKDWFWPPRPLDSHKGLFGHVLIIGGGFGMPGSVWLSAMGAFRAGAGTVTIATSPLNGQNAGAFLPEAMVVPITAKSLLPYLKKATVCIIGPGLGQDTWAQDMWNVVQTATCPLIIDAEALHWLSEFKGEGVSEFSDNRILTPHPGEAAKLLGISAAAVQADRRNAILMLQAQYGGYAVLKGFHTLVCNKHGVVSLCQSGNPGMATAGMGDLLSGIIAGLVAQNIPLDWAAKFGVWCHAKSADLAVKDIGERGLLTTDLLPFLRKVINQSHRYVL